jgi:hypothetical protein
VTPSNAANDNLVNRTVSLWQSRAPRDLSAEDARQIAENIVGFFTILSEWSRSEISSAANDDALNLKADGAASHQHFKVSIRPGGQGESWP